MIPTKAISKYPEFVANQVLTQDQLNNQRIFLDTQNRLTRVKLVGVGIVCGLRVTLSETSGEYTITISEGYGITSDGWLIHTPEITLTHIGEYRDPNQSETTLANAISDTYPNYIPWRNPKDAKPSNPNLEQIEIDRLYDGEASLPDLQLITQADLANKILLLYLEKNPRNLKSCFTTDCNNKGIEIELNVVPLLVDKDERFDIDAICEKVVLDVVQVPRFHAGLKAATGLGLEGLTSYSEIQAGYAHINNYTTNALVPKIKTAYTKYALLLGLELNEVTFSTPLDALLEVNNTTQYHYDFFKDLAQAYNEFIYAACTLIKDCCPKRNFPRHLQLGLFDVNGGFEDTYRNVFYPSPVRNVMNRDLEKVRCLFERMSTLITSFNIEKINGTVEKQIINISGTISKATTWTNNNTYLLDGYVFVEGTTLTIESGTVIKAKEIPTQKIDGKRHEATVLIIQVGATLVARGTAEAPIIFTTERDNLAYPNNKLTHTDRGLWGGLVLLGNAQVSEPENMRNLILPSAIESGTVQKEQMFYGSSILAKPEQSGALKYVSIRHGGKSIGENDNVKGLVFAGISSEMKIDHVEVFACADHGVQIVGGDVKLSHIVSAFNGNDAFDWDSGWSGVGQFWFGIQAADKGDKGIDGKGGIFDNIEAKIFSKPTILNGTFIGSGCASKISAKNTYALSLRSGSGGTIANSFFTEYNNFLELRNQSISPNTSTRLERGDLIIRGNVCWNFCSNTNQPLKFEFDKEIIVEPSNSANKAALKEHLAENRNRRTTIDISISREPNQMLDPRPKENIPNYSIEDIPPKGEPIFKGAFDANEPLWLDTWTALYQHEYLPQNTEERQNNDNINILKITPSHTEAYPLAQRTIPYYYNDLTNIWTLNKCCRIPTLSYEANLMQLPPNQGVAFLESFQNNPLQYNLLPYTFYRIEGHYKQDVLEVYNKIIELKRIFNLNFKIKILTLNEDDKLNLENPTCDISHLQADYAVLRAEALCLLAKELQNDLITERKVCMDYRQLELEPSNIAPKPQRQKTIKIPTETNGIGLSLLDFKSGDSRPTLTLTNPTEIFEQEIILANSAIMIVDFSKLPFEVNKVRFEYIQSTESDSRYAMGINTQELMPLDRIKDFNKPTDKFQIIARVVEEYQDPKGGIRATKEEMTITGEDINTLYVGGTTFGLFSLCAYGTNESSSTSNPQAISTINNIKKELIKSLSKNIKSFDYQTFSENWKELMKQVIILKLQLANYVENIEADFNPYNNPTWNDFLYYINQLHSSCLRHRLATLDAICKRYAQTNTFANYASKNYGLEHMAGIVPGGTFFIVSDNGKVVADFSTYSSDCCCEVDLSDLCVAPVAETKYFALEFSSEKDEISAVLEMTPTNNSKSKFTKGEIRVADNVSKEFKAQITQENQFAIRYQVKKEQLLASDNRVLIDSFPYIIENVCGTDRGVAMVHIKPAKQNTSDVEEKKPTVYRLNKPVKGVVIDKSKGAVIDAKIMLKEISRATSTNVEGRFVMDDLKLGNYTLEVSFGNTSKIYNIELVEEGGKSFLEVII